MHRFFTTEIPLEGETGTLDTDESRHAFRVLRLRREDLIELLDGNGGRATAQITDLLGAPRNPVVEYWVVKHQDVPHLACPVRLCVAPPRFKAMAQVVQQAAELGVMRISPLLCDYSVARPRKKSTRQHWEQEAISALKQSGNPFLPQLDRPREFAAVLADCRGTPILFGDCRTGEKRNVEWAEHAEHVAVWVGPEGGFSDEEHEQLIAAGAQPVRAAPWTLRVETAVVALIGWVRAAQSE